MIRALVVADSGSVMSSVTAPLSRLPGVEIVAYANGRCRIGEIVRHIAPDVVLIDEMSSSGNATQRVAEVHAISPTTPVIGLVEQPSSTWTADGLRAGAAAVVPRGLEAATLSLVLNEVLGAGTSKSSLPTERSAA